MLLRRLILWDRNAGVKIRTGHILNCLFHSTTPNKRSRNVSDLKYIRFIKQVPQFRIRLQDALLRLDQIISFSKLEDMCGNIITESIDSLSSRFPRVSEFQLRSAISILSNLQNGSGDISIVANTGSGKSLSYQLPLILWIMTKKLKSFLGNAKNKNCTAILIFPRKVLAHSYL